MSFSQYLKLLSWITYFFLISCSSSTVCFNSLTNQLHLQNTIFNCIAILFKNPLFFLLVVLQVWEHAAQERPASVRCTSVRFSSVHCFAPSGDVQSQPLSCPCSQPSPLCCWTDTRPTLGQNGTSCTRQAPTGPLLFKGLSDWVGMICVFDIIILFLFPVYLLHQVPPRSSFLLTSTWLLVSVQMLMP